MARSNVQLYSSDKRIILSAIITILDTKKEEAINIPILILGPESITIYKIPPNIFMGS